MSHREATGAVSKLAEQFAELWSRSDSPPDVFSFLAGHPAASVSEQAEVLFVDQFQRSRAGLALPVEAYLQRLPLVAAEEAIKLQLVVEEFGHRWGRGDEPTPDEFVARFPELKDRLLETLSLSPAGGETVAAAPGSATDITFDSGASSAAAATKTARFAGYELLHEIARGGMGVVYKARQTKLNRVVALKMIKSGELAGEEEVRRFKAEAEAAAQLDHPNIVPIYEVGESGLQHFFSMGFVDGASLADRLNDGPLPPREAAELLGTIAAAVQYAHEQGIVHRDLKPANVLLTAAGGSSSASVESDDTRPGIGSTAGSRVDHSSIGRNRLPIPKITDFGLAKNFAADSDMTATGQVLGTPSYMPPEQAAGATEKIGPLADVYALGALLYATLTGRPPFQAANVMETLKQVLEREPVSPRTQNPAVDRDLETICLKCLEKDPRKRYPSASDLADDLTRYLAGEPITARPLGPFARSLRWCRRNKTAAALVALLLVFSFGGTAVAVNQMRLSTALGREKDRADKKVVELAAALGRETAEKRRADRKAADLAIALNRVTSEFNRAESNLVWADRTVKNFILEIAEDGGPLSRTPGTQPVRRRLLQMGREYYRKLIDDNPGAALSPRLAQANFQLGYVLTRESGQRRKAEKAYQKAVDIYKHLINTDPAEKAHRANLAMTNSNRAANAYEHGDADKAVSLYRQALQEFERLHRDDPENADFQSRLANIHNSLGIISMYSGELDDALASYRRALTINERLANAHPDEAEYQSDLASNFNSIGTVSQKLGDRDKALAAYRRALDLCQRLVREHGGEIDYRRKLATAHNNIGGILLELRRPQKAYEANQRALEIRQRLAQANPSVIDFQNDCASSLGNISSFYLRAGKTTEARAALEQAVAIYQRIVRQNPAIVESQNLLAASRYALGLFHSNHGSPQQAFSEYEKAAAILKPLVARHRQLTDPRKSLASCLINMSIVCRRLARPQDAERYAAEAIPFLTGLRKQFPENKPFRQSLRNAYGNHALALELLGRYREAAAAWKNALAHDTGVGRAYFQKQRCLSLARAGRHREANTLAVGLLKTTNRAQTAYDFACAFAISSAAARRDASLSPEQRQRISTRYAGNAIAVLRDLARSDYFSNQRTRRLLHTDADLNPLRASDDFRNLAEKLRIETPAWARLPLAAVLASPAKPAQEPRAGTNN